MNNKFIKRDGQEATTIFDNRTLDKDYRTLKSLLKPGITVLDVGCGTGAITKDIAASIGEKGKVIGIDNTDRFIESGKKKYGHVKNMELIHIDFFEFQTKEKFDLIVSARTLQWLSRVEEALRKMRTLLTPTGKISILDYNHTKIDWVPAPPDSMRQFYHSFLKWRADAGMNNQIADDLPILLQDAGFRNIEKINSDECYKKGDKDFDSSVGIWSKVAGSKQMVEEGYIEDDLRVHAIEEYNSWIQEEAISMTMKLNEVRGEK